MSNMYGLLIGLMFFLPLLVGVVSIFIDRTLRKKLLVSLIIFMTLGGSFGFYFGEANLNTPFSFMEEMITFSISYSALIIYQVSILILLGMVVLNSDKHGRFLTGYHLFLLSTSLSFGFIAFISGQFLIRYIALDIVGLLASLIVINSFEDRIGLRRSSIIFSILRFGDLCLLASILLLYHQAGTIDISQMIEISTTLPSEIQNWIFGGFFIAILVKTATWPFFFWMHHARQGTNDLRFWVSGILMPGLGFYLLYRIQPLIISNGNFKELILIFSVGLLILVMLMDIIDQQKYGPYVDIGGLFGLFLFVAGSFGPKEHLKYFIAGVLLYRFLSLIKDKASGYQVRNALILFPLFMNVLYIGVNFSEFSPSFFVGWLSFTILFVGWGYWHEFMKVKQRSKLFKSEERRIVNAKPGGFIQRGAKWLNKKIEIGLFTNGIYRLSGLFIDLAVWLNKKIETDFLTSGFYRLSDNLVDSADWISERVEQSIEKIYSWLGEQLMAVSEGTLFKFEVESAQKSEEFLEDSLNSLDKYEQNVLKKNMRLDLAWIPLFLIVILVLILVV